MASDDLYNIAVLIDDLKSEDVTVRLNSVSRLSLVAKTLGPERTRTELMPFLQESLDDEDEVLVALAGEMNHFVPLIGGEEYAFTLLPILESLVSTEEAVVRDKAVVALLTMINSASNDDQLKPYLECLMRMATNEWFTSKASSCGLFSTVYPRVNETIKAELVRLYTLLCSDETPMVRRSAATKLANWKMTDEKDSVTVPGFAEVLDVELIKSAIVPLYNELAHDSQDSVRFLSVELAITIARRLESESEKEALLMGPLRELLKDGAWRVRYMAADRFVQLQEALGPSITQQDLIPAFISFLRDIEAEVRTAAARHVPEFCLNLPVSVREDTTVRLVLPAVKELVVDPSQHVRSALATQIMNLSTVLGKQNTIDDLIPLFLQLLKDEFPEVRLNIISKLDAVNKVVGIELLSQALVPAIVELAEDRQWRVRLAIIAYVPLLAEQLGQDFFDDKLCALCMAWLNDCVYSIREAATENLRKLAETFGAQWAQENIIPKVFSLAHHPNYLYRMTTLFSINALAPVIGSSLVATTMVPVVCEMSLDTVPNVRFNVAKTLELLAGLINDKTVCATCMVETLNTLSNDADKDVKFFANKALLVAA